MPSSVGRMQHRARRAACLGTSRVPPASRSMARILQHQVPRGVCTRARNLPRGKPSRQTPRRPPATPSLSLARRPAQPARLCMCTRTRELARPLRCTDTSKVPRDGPDISSADKVTFRAASGSGARRARRSWRWKAWSSRAPVAFDSPMARCKHRQPRRGRWVLLVPSERRERPAPQVLLVPRGRSARQVHKDCKVIPDQQDQRDKQAPPVRSAQRGRKALRDYRVFRDHKVIRAQPAPRD